jgi:thiamine-phosphate pyrophosphorylase
MTKPFLVVDAGRMELQADALTAAVRRGKIACTLLLPAKNHVDLPALVRAIQAADCATLVFGDASLALTTGADGVHLAFEADTDIAEKTYRSTRAILGAGRIVGASAGLARHNAMVLAELGADYVALGGEPDNDAAAQRDMVAWWSEMLEVPCVAWGADSPAAALAFMQAGADFVAAGPASSIESALTTLSVVSGGAEVGSK